MLTHRELFAGIIKSKGGPTGESVPRIIAHQLPSPDLRSEPCAEIPVSYTFQDSCESGQREREAEGGVPSKSGWEADSKKVILQMEIRLGGNTKSEVGGAKSGKNFCFANFADCRG